MVLWEITAITAYFLGLKRTYKLALRIQRRLIGPNHPKIRDFVYRRTRDVFNVAVSVHRNIQERDLEAGRNIGSRILRCLDRMKPSAQIRPHHHLKSDGPDCPKLASKPRTRFKAPESPSSSKSDGRVMFSPLDVRSKVLLPSVMMSSVMRQGKLLGGANSCQFRKLSYYNAYDLGVERKRGVFQGVFRKDIMEFMMRS
ncbi:hypothetical protein LUZ60_009485 [Juncus effusus]|nr:hypothetical protein LUZ60_009485 [Juncus effusus]